MTVPRNRLINGKYTGEFGYLTGEFTPKRCKPYAIRLFWYGWISIGFYVITACSPSRSVLRSKYANKRSGES